MATIPLQIRVKEEVLNEVERVANAAGIERNDYILLWLGRIAQIKLDYGLDALTSIPKEFFKTRPGRPTTASRTAGQGTTTADDSIQDTTRVPMIEDRGTMART